MNRIKEYKRKIEVRYQALLTDKKRVSFIPEKESDEWNVYWYNLDNNICNFLILSSFIIFLLIV